ncbi:MAG: hypothetical protein GC185_10550 [Alphaproteobacteria bacterium]|nr:hypothetical protein [Alphaproteobacteria bacterium]
MANKFYFDTEFVEYDAVLADGRTQRVVELISIGVVDQNGRTFYAVSDAFNEAEAKKNPFIAQHILSQLPPPEERLPLAQIKKDLLAYIGQGQATLHYWYAPQDSLLMLNLLGPDFLNLPANIDPMPINVAQTFREKGHPRHMVPPHNGKAHHALVDAQWVKELDERLHGKKFTPVQRSPKRPGMG